MWQKPCIHCITDRTVLTGRRMIQRLLILQKKKQKWFTSKACNSFVVVFTPSNCVLTDLGELPYSRISNCFILLILYNGLPFTYFYATSDTCLTLVIFMSCIVSCVHIFSTYGDNVGVQYAESILNFSRNCDYAMFIVDHLLDILTGNEHGKTSHYITEQKMLRREDELLDSTLVDSDMEEVEMQPANQTEPQVCITYI